MEEKVYCQTPTPGKEGVRIAKWKYDRLRSIILSVIPANEVGITFKELPDRVRSQLSTEEITQIGSVRWYTTTIKLDLEARGEIERIEGSSPQRLHRRR
jgi:hypothetical protein